MAKYKAHPNYTVLGKNGRIQFDYHGDYVTEDKEEIAALDALCPTWMKRIDVSKVESKQTEPFEKVEPSESAPKQTEQETVEPIGESEPSETPKEDEEKPEEKKEDKSKSTKKKTKRSSAK
ncbi:hypothetical protein [Mechercharimyces sp. CAU 1602]|uniref:hypothetical protein n=1 Tax=Mechercharimyces sp. CAU 1602 TaxID=2973933 RepID=UPI002162AE68|nr:hypothetical protein [Mechercharimyces sp. CAU 1602]MCS1350317.1 hypothetical protein [Mechercharimyces sp. CAU 1602]